MFEWLSKLLEAIGSVIPRLVLIKRTHGAIRFGLGGSAKELKPGLHVWWPLFQEVIEIPVARQTINLNPQTIMTADGSRISVSGVLVYSISDVGAALSESYEVDETIADVGLTSVVEVIMGHTIEELKASMVDKTLSTKLSRKCRAKLNKFGVRIISCALTDFTPCSVIRLLTDKHEGDVHGTESF
jgi:regulator of protease activity HflC (stomatin/prohibitin superfamily)